MKCIYSKKSDELFGYFSKLNDIDYYEKYIENGYLILSMQISKYWIKQMPIAPLCGNIIIFREGIPICSIKIGEKVYPIVVEYGGRLYCGFDRRNYPMEFELSIFYLFLDIINIFLQNNVTIRKYPWPYGKKSCFALTGDIHSGIFGDETKAIERYINFLNNKFPNLKPTFFCFGEICESNQYLATLLSKKSILGGHGYKRTFYHNLSEEKQNEDINKAINAFKYSHISLHGWRNHGLVYTENSYNTLEKNGIKWTSNKKMYRQGNIGKSFSDCLPITLPYYVGGILEIPLLPEQDYTLLEPPISTGFLSGKDAMEYYEGLLELALIRNDLLVFLFHPYLIDEKNLYEEIYELIKKINDKQDIFISDCGSIYNWWKSITDMSINISDNVIIIKAAPKGSAILISTKDYISIESKNKNIEFRMFSESKFDLPDTIKEYLCIFHEEGNYEINLNAIKENKLRDTSISNQLNNAEVEISLEDKPYIKIKNTSNRYLSARSIEAMIGVREFIKLVINSISCYLEDSKGYRYTYSISFRKINIQMDYINILPTYLRFNSKIRVFIKERFIIRKKVGK